MLGHFSSTAEVEITGTAEELVQLAEHVRAVRTLSLQADHDPAPYAQCLTAVETHDTDAKVSITIDPSRRTLVITGDAASRDLLARNVEKMWEATDSGGHLHIEHYPGHPYLADGSGTLVLAKP